METITSNMQKRYIHKGSHLKLGTSIHKYYDSYKVTYRFTLDLHITYRFTKGMQYRVVMKQEQIIKIIRLG